VDGSLRAQLGWTGSPGRTTTTRPLSIGNYQLEEAPHAFLEGMIQDVGLWRTDLPVGAINNILRGERYYESFLVGRWKLDEGSGHIAADAGGNGHVGTVEGNAAWVHSARPPNEFTHRSEPMPVDFNQTSLRFDGEDDFVVSRSDVDLANQSFSIEFWAKPDRLHTSSVAIAQTQGISQDPQFANRGLHIGWRSNNTFTFAFFYNDLNTPDRWTDLGWHHWACTFDASTGDRRIYRDGILVAHDNTIPPEGSQPQLYAGSGPIQLGLRDFIPADDWPFAGNLREVRI
jgi:hypothetical protein